MTQSGVTPCVKNRRCEHVTLLADQSLIEELYTLLGLCLICQDHDLSEKTQPELYSVAVLDFQSYLMVFLSR